jgi:mono/diheme cytochrome c family protein
VFRKGLLSWATYGALGVVSVAPAGGQNLDAHKSGAQIFSEVCINCHRSPRALRNASTSFLREHYTTGPGMASIVAAFLSSAAGDPRAAASPAQPKRPPALIRQGVADVTEKQATDAAHNTWRAQTADPKTSPPSGLLRDGSASVRIEVAKPANSVESPASPLALPHSPALEEFEE